MISGAFQVGETVKGSMRSVGDTSTSEADREISFRLAKQITDPEHLILQVKFLLKILITKIKLFQVLIRQPLLFLM